MIVFTAIAAALGILGAWLVAGPMPTYLLYATRPTKADAVVVIGGGDFQAREQKAVELVEKMWAKFVIYPYAGEIYEARVSRALVTPEKTAALAMGVRRDVQRAYVEQTHVEIHQAFKLLQHIGASRAIFVSSPYHMRRIALMAGAVFNEHRYTLAFVPTPYDPAHAPWFTNWEDVKWVLSEYLKIAWFFIYAPLL